MDYHPVVSQIKNLLVQNNFWFEIFEHEPVRTSEEAAEVRTGYTLAQGAKAIIVRIKRSEKEKFFIMLVIPGDKKFDTTKVKNHFTAKDIRFANEDEVDSITGGVLPGGVPPFGNLFKLKVVADPNLFLNDRLIFNAGDRRVSIAMKTGDYQVLVKPEVVSIV